METGKTARRITRPYGEGGSAGGTPAAGSNAAAKMRRGTATRSARTSTDAIAKLAGGMQPMQTCGTVARSSGRGA